MEVKRGQNVQGLRGHFKDLSFAYKQREVTEGFLIRGMT